MNFTDVPFLILLVATYALWLLVRRRERPAVALLVTASLLFYGHNHWRLLPILFAYCLIDWGVGVWMERASRPRLVLGLGVGFNLAVLCFYKYVPLLVTGPKVRQGVNLGVRATLSDIGQTVAQNFGAQIAHGVSFLPQIV